MPAARRPRFRASRSARVRPSIRCTRSPRFVSDCWRNERRRSTSPESPAISSRTFEARCERSVCTVRVSESSASSVASCAASSASRVCESATSGVGGFFFGLREDDAAFVQRAFRGRKLIGELFVPPRLRRLALQRIQIARHLGRACRRCAGGSAASLRASAPRRGAWSCTS